ncbi:hypothetical protein [Paenibacillus assamensis]|uniref:hypothetical protein n=1 Tax=Paenibacillus assamensis TaxID=311244 RepID=UPI0004907A22|nr:hypothetical protein [Paenibacillus assamensis]
MSAKVCQRCSGKNDVTEFNIGDEKHRLCIDCRSKFLIKAEMGRPPIGITRKISLTLAQEDWDWLDKGNRSKTIRTLVHNERLSDERKGGL